MLGDDDGPPPEQLAMEMSDVAFEEPNDNSPTDYVNLFSTSGTVNLESDVVAICSLAPNPYFRHQCVHGVSHGLLAWTTYELHDALPLCDRMPIVADQGPCSSGVFMENVLGGLSGKMGHVTEYLRDDDPVFPCNVIDERYVDDCYFYQTSHMRKVFDRDFSKVAQACTEAPTSARENCFQSYGREVGNATRKDTAKAIEYGNFAPAGQKRVSCIEGAAQDRFWEEPGADDAIAMCRMVADETEKSACYRTIIVRARDVFSTQIEFDPFCAGLEETWRDTFGYTQNRPIAGS